MTENTEKTLKTNSAGNDQKGQKSQDVKGGATKGVIKTTAKDRLLGRKKIDLKSITPDFSKSTVIPRPKK